MGLFEKEKNLEGFMRKQEKALKENQIYSRLMFLPVIVILVAASVLAYNFTVGRELTEKAAEAVVIEKAEVLEQKEFDAESTDLDTVTESEKINLNTATLEELDTLSGIGESKAKGIIDAREKMGGFRTVDDVLNAEGIGEKLLKQIRQYVFVE